MTEYAVYTYGARDEMDALKRAVERVGTFDAQVYAIEPPDAPDGEALFTLSIIRLSREEADRIVEEVTKRGFEVEVEDDLPF